MASPAFEREVVDLVYRVLADLRLEPRLIPRSSIEELRGGISCLDLKPGGGVDAVVILSRMSYESSRIEGGKKLYRMEYAVRGSIRGVLHGRIMVRTDIKTKGFLRKEIEKLNWRFPRETRDTTSTYSSAEASPPGPGELWKGCPHEALAEGLNEDRKLMAAVRSILEERKGSLTLTVFSDRWGESVRIAGSIWLGASDLTSVYASPAYVTVADRIGEHVKEIRRRFGGIAF